MEDKLTAESIIDYFAAVPDPRVDRRKDHPLVSILVVGLLAVICGADSFVAMETFGESKKQWLSSFLDLPKGIPSHDTFGRVFAVLNPHALEAAFREWISALAKLGDDEVVAIDGKTLRRSFQKAGAKSFVHMVSAWATHNRVVLGQYKTEEKSNEITAIPRLLELLNIKGAMVTIDAMGCQKDIAAKIVEGDADYLLAVKDNQPTLLKNVSEIFQRASQDSAFLDRLDFFETHDTGHGRTEVRRCWTSADLKSISGRNQWKALAGVALVEVDRTIGDKTSTEQRYFISSKKALAAKDALAASRSHWGIENELHWVLDVAFREDDCRVRAGHAAENFAVLRHIALNLLKNLPGRKIGVKTCRMRAGWDHDFLLKVLHG
jgi:predicted transposase YbfD/YdcC